MTTSTSPDVPITLIGGPTVLIEYAGLRILTDPTFDEPRTYGSDVTGYEGFTLVKTHPPALSVEAVGHVDVVLASHEHVDNLDLTGREMAASVEHVFTTTQVAGILPGAQALVEWDVRTVTSSSGREVAFTAVPAHHGPEGIWQAIGPVLGFVIECPGEKTLYFSGDNSDVDVVRHVAERFPSIEIAVLNVGGPKFEEMLGDHYITFSDETATEAAEVLAGAQIIPIHADSWQHFTQTTSSMKAVASEHGFSDRVIAMHPGQTATA
ncbi:MULTISPECIES: MBL fold metallo-hydrolase [unclassified Aeromicrobium]|uniref:MBL fold metallo-hydrolase n=1 Tax=unclassified Aeromicrobium TaxID=2633570 RepID=UPI00288B1B24|nr:MULTISPECIES: MBL fold metallo-hydrolase [unclassified Aeromicrobium]